MSYAFLADAKAQQRADQTFDDDKMQWALIETSRRVDVKFSVKRGWPFFEPVIGTRSILLTSDIVSTWENRLDLDYPMLALTSIDKNGTDISSSVRTQAFTGANVETPFDALYLTSGCGCTWYTVGSCTSCEPQGVTVTGEWGMVRGYDDAFQSEDTVQDAGGINASATSITVTDADGVNFENLTPRFSEGQLIQIDSEWLRVTGVNTTTNVLTVRRGQNGSTAAAHANGADIDVFYPDEGIRGAVAAQAAAFYERRGAFNNASFDGVTLVQYPADLLQRLYGSLQGYANL